MRMDRQRDIFGQRTHFDCEYAFCNQFSGACAHDTYPQHALTLRINNELGHAFRSVEGHRSSRGGPGEFRDFKLAILFLRFRLSEATPRDFRLFSMRLCSGRTRSRSAPGSSPESISTTDTLQPRAA